MTKNFILIFNILIKSLKGNLRNNSINNLIQSIVEAHINLTTRETIDHVQKYARERIQLTLKENINQTRNSSGSKASSIHENQFMQGIEFRQSIVTEGSCLIPFFTFDTDSY